MKDMQTEKRNLEFGISHDEQLNTDKKLNPRIILYSNDCPKCKVLENKLDTLKIHHIKIKKIEEIRKKGFLFVPILEVDGNIMNFSQAINWLTTQNFN